MSLHFLVKAVDLGFVLILAGCVLQPWSGWGGSCGSHMPNCKPPGSGSSSFASPGLTFCPALGSKQHCPEEQCCCQRLWSWRDRQFPGHKSIGSFNFKNSILILIFSLIQDSGQSQSIWVIHSQWLVLLKGRGFCFFHFFQFWKYHFYVSSLPLSFQARCFYEPQ